MIDFGVHLPQAGKESKMVVAGFSLRLFKGHE